MKLQQINEPTPAPANDGPANIRPGLSLRPSLLILATYTILALILTYPLIFNLTTTLPNDIGDPLLNTWILAWDGHVLLTDPLNFFNANIFYPLPNTLAYSEHLLSTALLALPIQLISGEPVLTYNLSLLATFPLAAFGMYLLALRWTGQRRAAFIAGLIFAFNPYRFAAIAHLQLLTFQWLPFALLLLDVLLRPRGLGSGDREAGNPRSPTLDPRLLALGVFLLLQILASWYLALYTVLILGIYLLAALLARRFNPSRLLLPVSIFLISFLLTLPFLLPYVALIDDLRQARPLSLALSLAAAPTDFAAAAPFNRLFGPLTEPLRARPNFTEENTLFPGLVAPLLALVALLAALEYCVLRTAYSISRRLSGGFMCHVSRVMFHVARPGGPRLLPGGFRLSARRVYVTCPAGLRRLPGGFRSPAPQVYVLRFTFYASLITLILSSVFTFPTPYAALASLFPPSTVIRVPARWIIPALFALSGLAAFGYAIINPARGTPPQARKRAQGKCYQLTNFKSQPSISNFKFLISNLLLPIASLLLIAETLPTPLPLAPVENRHTLNPAYHRLAQQAGDFSLVELPLHSAPAPEFPEVKRLYASTLGWWRLVNGYSGYTPPRQPQLARDLADFPAEGSITALQMLAGPNPAGPGRLAASPPPSFYLLVHPGEAPMDRALWETTDRWQAERNPALHPLGQFEGNYLYLVIPPDSQRFTAPPLATLGPNQTIRLLAIDIEPAPTAPGGPRTRFFWQPTTSLSTAYTVFIHLRAPDGFVRSQADGPPVSGHHPTTAWQPGQVIQDIHPLPPADFNQVDHLAIGLYDPATGERLPAFGPDGQRLAGDAVIVPVR